ncbi:MAG: hypothetical protein U9P68_14440 [Pseudomonadota bacterium]|nr:hypothetical protein [Pseudomonadota bacterium]
MTQTAQKQEAVREVVGIFDHEGDLQAAVDALLGAGFDRADLSLLADASAVTGRLGYADWQARKLEDDPNAPCMAYTSGESRGDSEGAVLGIPMYVMGVTAAGIAAAAGGPLAITLAATAAGTGTGAVIGGMLAHLIGQHHVKHIEEQIRHGGLLIWVRVWNDADVTKAETVLSEAGARDIHSHDIGAPQHAAVSPESILASTTLSQADKISVLRRWCYDVREMLVAEDEGMGDCQGELFSRINNALIALGAEPNPEHSAPTRQGGG